MASSRRGASAPAYAHSISLKNQLKNIFFLAKKGEETLSVVASQLTKIIHRIYHDSYYESGSKSRRLSNDEMVRLEALLNYLVINFGRNAEERRVGRPIVYLLEAKYVMRRCHVEQALGLYRDIESHYPTFADAYKTHAQLLRYCDRDDEAQRVLDQMQINKQRFNMSKSARIPGGVNVKSMGRYGMSFFSTAPDLKNVAQDKQCDAGLVKMIGYAAI